MPCLRQKKTFYLIPVILIRRRSIVVLTIRVPQASSTDSQKQPSTNPRVCLVRVVLRSVMASIPIAHGSLYCRIGRTGQILTRVHPGARMGQGSLSNGLPSVNCISLCTANLDDSAAYGTHRGCRAGRVDPWSYQSYSIDDALAVRPPIHSWPRDRRFGQITQEGTQARDTI